MLEFLDKIPKNGHSAMAAGRQHALRRICLIGAGVSAVRLVMLLYSKLRQALTGTVLQYF